MYVDSSDVSEYPMGNYQIFDIVTPIKVQRYGELLRATSYDQFKTAYLVNGFREGFDIGYKGPVYRRDTARNLPISVGSEMEIWTKLMKEVQLGRHAGPFKKPPFKYYVQSPIGLVPKAGNQTRLIFHLSYDFGTEMHQKSLNYFTPDEDCTVKYRDLDYAVETCLSLCRNSDQNDREDQPTDVPQEE